MVKKSQNRFTAEEKYRILEEGESGTLSINEVCRRHGLSTVTYYTWRQKMRQAAIESLRGDHRQKTGEKSRHELELEAENERLKHTVIELSQENVILKKKHLG